MRIISTVKETALIDYWGYFFRINHSNSIFYPKILTLFALTPLNHP